MADVADIASERAGPLFDAQVAAIRRAAQSVGGSPGLCRSCAQPVQQGAFCDADCRDDFERQSRSDRINGRAAR